MPIPESGLKRKMLPHNYELFLDSHVNMGEIRRACECKLHCIQFRLSAERRSYSCHEAESSIQALTVSLSLLKKGGILMLCIYSGGDSGFEERDALLEWLKVLDSRKFLVIKTEYYNRPNHPPMPVLVVKL